MTAPLSTGLSIGELVTALEARGYVERATTPDPSVLVERVAVIAPGEPLVPAPGEAVVVMGTPSRLERQRILELADERAMVLLGKPGLVAEDAAPGGSAAVVIVAEAVGWADAIAEVHNLLAGAPTPTRPSEPAARDLFELAEQVAAGVGGQVTIEDDTGRLVAYSSDHDPGDEVRVATIVARRSPAGFVRALTEQGTMRQILQSRRAVAVTGLGPGIGPRLALALRWRSTRLGIMWALVDEPSASTRAAFEEAGEQAAALMIRRRADSERTQRIELDQLAVLLHGGAAVAAIPLSRELHGVHRVAALSIAATDPTERSVLRARLEQRLDAPPVLGAPVREVRAGQLSNLHYLILTSTDEQASDAEVEAWLRELLTETGSGSLLDLRVGIGGPTATVADLPRSRSEAEHALTVVRGLDDPSLPWCLSSCWPQAALLRVLDATARANLHTLSPLRRVRAHDDEHASELVPTLAAWLRHHGSVRAAAESLHLHPNTLRYRLQRLAELGVDLGDPDVRLVLAMQLRFGEFARPYADA